VHALLTVETLHLFEVNHDILIFERISKGDVVLVAVNRGQDQTITLHGSLGMNMGLYRGVIEDASDANQGNYLRVRPQDRRYI
jgi:hypothetical protein